MPSPRTAMIQKQMCIILKHYIKYCKTLRKVIKEAKKQHYSRLTAKSNNKITTWNIIKKETGKIHSVQQVSHLTCE